jgi:TRAP-type C4-dicarboxylate transport system substrate-binding protein
MQLKLQLTGMVMDLAPTVWNQLDPEAQKAVVQALRAATTKAINHQVEQKNENEEDKDDRQN